LADYSSAIRQYDTALLVAKSAKNSLDENTLAELLNNRGVCFYQLNNYATAVENFKNAIRIKGEAKYYFNRGKTFLKLNQLKEAEEDVTKALNMQPQNAMWNYTL